MIDSAAFAKTAHSLRRLGIAHRCLRWIRRVLLAGFVEAILEFARFIWRESPSFGPPADYFSLYQALRTCDPPLRGRVLLTDQGVPRVTSDSLLTSGFSQHKEQPWPIFWCHVPQARLVSQSLALLQAPKCLALESVYGLQRIRTDPAFRYFRLPPPERLKGSWTSIVSKWVPLCGPCNYTHWLLDALPRLAVLDELPPETGIIVPQTLTSWQKEALELLGVLERCRSTRNTHVLIDSFYFSSPTAMLDCYNPYAVNFLRKTFFPRRDPAFRGPARFVLRRSGKWRPAANEQEMYRLFEDHGWAVVDTEQLTFAEEVALFHSADAVAGVLGSGLTNVLFCKPGCSVLHIVPEFYRDGWLDWIVQVVGCQYEFRICPSNYRQSFNVDLKWLELALRRITEQTT